MNFANNKTTVIAEIGWNFMGDMELASDMVESAAGCGVDVCKFQYWDPSLLKAGEWDHDGRREIYNKARLDPGKIECLQEICVSNGVEFLVSIFSLDGAKLMRDLGIKSIKIPSHESYNLALYRYSLENFSSIFASLGACTQKELNQIANLYKLRPNSSCLFNAMHCVSSYPCEISKLNLRRVYVLRQLFGDIGFSDHSDSTISGALSVAMGCTVIEKHFTTDNNLPGRDNKFALETKFFSEYVQNIRAAEEMVIDRGIDFQEVERDIVENYRGRWSLADQSA